MYGSLTSISNDILPRQWWRQCSVYSQWDVITRCPWECEECLHISSDLNDKTERRSGYWCSPTAGVVGDPSLYSRRISPPGHIRPGRIPGSVYTSDMCGRLHGWKQKPPRRLQEMRSSFPLLNGAKDPRDGASFHYMRSLHGKCRCRGCDEVMLSLEKQSTDPAVIKKAAGRFSRDSFHG